MRVQSKFPSFALPWSIDCYWKCKGFDGKLCLALYVKQVAVALNSEVNQPFLSYDAEQRHMKLMRFWITSSWGSQFEVPIIS